MPVNIGTNNPGSNNKRVGGSTSIYTQGGLGGLVGLPIWNDFQTWDDVSLWVD